MWIGVEEREFFDRRSIRFWNEDREGVRPPEGREVHSSIREAPFWAARRAEGGLKEAISRLTIFEVFVGG